MLPATLDPGALVDWPRVECLLPPRLHEALHAAHAGDFARARALCDDIDARDAFASGSLALVRGLSDLASGEELRGRKALARVARGPDAALGIAASLALVERDVEARRFTAARAWIQRWRRRARRPDDSLGLESTLLWIELQRRGELDPAWVERLRRRLERRDPASLHARVHLLRAETALFAGDLPAAVAAQRDAGPFVRAAASAALDRQHARLAELLRAPFAEVDDWEQPLRPVSREDVAEIEAGGWTLWIDALHRRVRCRAGENVQALGFARQARAWQVLEALMRTPRRRLSWAQAVAALDLPSVEDARERAAKLAAHASDLEFLEVDAAGLRLRHERYVLLYPGRDLRPAETRLLAHLAVQPGTRAAQLARDDLSPRTVQRHLFRLRRDGFLRLVGGGSEARYYLI